MEKEMIEQMKILRADIVMPERWKGMGETLLDDIELKELVSAFEEIAYEWEVYDEDGFRHMQMLYALLGEKMADILEEYLEHWKEGDRLMFEKPNIGNVIDFNRFLTRRGKK